MKQTFIEVHAHKEVHDIVLNPLMQGRVGLVASIQYLDLLPALAQRIPNSVIGGQVLGCNATNALRLVKDVDCYLFLGEGRFHPLRIAQETKKPVFIASGDLITQEEVVRFEQQRKGRQLRYLTAKTVGLLVSLKPGQKFGSVERLKARIRSEGKEVFVLLDDTFNVASLENFSGIDCFVNTACPRLEGQHIIAAEELPRSSLQ